MSRCSAISPPGKRLHEIAANKVASAVLFRQFLTCWRLIKEISRNAKYRSNEGLEYLQCRMPGRLVMTEFIVVNQGDRARVAVDFVTLLTQYLVLPLFGSELRKHRLDRLDICAANAPKIIVEIQSELLSQRPSLAGRDTQVCYKTQHDHH